MTDLKTAAQRALEAWDESVLPKANDGMMQERMEGLRTAIEQALSARVPNGWQPIATAPRDGQNILLRFGSDGVSQGKYIPGLPYPWQFIDTNDGISWLINRAVDAPGGPSHWMPIPDAAPQPPAQTAEPTLWQMRLRIRGDERQGWSAWSECNAASAKAYLASTDTQWEYEVRALYTAPQPPAQEARVPGNVLNEVDFIISTLRGYPMSIARNDAVGAALRLKAMLNEAPSAQKARAPVASKGSLRDMMIDALLNTAPQPPAQREWVGLTDEAVRDIGARTSPKNGGGK